jgi:hypothetical protein
MCARPQGEWEPTSSGAASETTYALHIHEGYGAEVVAWKPVTSEVNRNGTSTSTIDSHNGGGPLLNQYPKPTECAIAYGQESLMVNAAIMTGKNKPGNAP